jgi:hypothetical protein
MRTNDVILLGSPGTDLAHSAADLRAHLEGGQVYVGSAASDPVTQFGRLPTLPAPWWGDGATIGLGADPASAAFGAQRFQAEVPGVSWNPFEDHSHYYNPNSESLRSIALITTGQGASLDDLGLTAPQRVSLPPTSPLGPVGRVLPDPELFRPPGW